MHNTSISISPLPLSLVTSDISDIYHKKVKKLAGLGWNIECDYETYPIRNKGNAILPVSNNFKPF